MATTIEQTVLRLKNRYEVQKLASIKLSYRIGIGKIILVSYLQSAEAIETQIIKDAYPFTVFFYPEVGD